MISTIPRIIIFSSFLVLSMFALTGCEESTEVAKAQECLDKIDDTVAAATLQSQAQTCINIVSSVDNSDADIIRCSGYFLKGGLTTAKIVSSAQALSDGGSNNEAIMIGALALSSTADAKSANIYCSRSGISGLAYLGSLALMGTSLNSFAGGWTAGTVPTPAQISAALTTCQSGGCDDDLIGSSIVSLGDSYCAGSQSTNEVCTQLNQAVTNGNGDNTAIAKQFWTLLGQN